MCVFAGRGMGWVEGGVRFVLYGMHVSSMGQVFSDCLPYLEGPLIYF